MKTLARIVFATSLLAACGKAPESKDAPAPAGEKKDEGGGEGLGLPPFAKLFTSGLEKPGPYEEKTQSSDWSADAPHYLVLELDRPISELQTFSLLETAGTVPLRTITDALRKAAADANVRGIVLRSSALALDMAVAEELRAALVAYKGDGARRLVCHTESATNAVYYVLTACDRIGVAPLATIAIPGPAATPIHVKRLLDQVGVKADFLHVGAFKGAAEPLTREAPSPEMVQTLDAIVAQSHETLVAGMVDGRGMSREQATGAIDDSLFVDSAIVDARLADEIAVWESFLSSTTASTPWKKLRTQESPLEGFTALQRFIGLLPPDRPSEPHVALVYAVGSIIDGKGAGALGAREEIASRTAVAALRAIADDEQVRAVVLRVDSGGGSALASEQIWAAVREMADEKPVVVSMGSVAASGGYYISAGATEIHALENTLTGSIGVVGGKIVVRDALDKLGVQTYAVQRGKRAMMWSPTAAWTEDERAAVQKMMEATYDTFLERVASGRKLERDKVHEIAQGRVWTGVAARERKLVDRIGGLDGALARAAELGGVDTGAPIEVYPGTPTLRDILAGMGQVDATDLPGVAAVGNVLGRLDPGAAALLSLLRTIDRLATSPVLAVSFVRPPR